MKLTPVRKFASPGKHLCGLAWDGQRLWHSDGDTHLLYAMNPASGSILRTLPCPDVRTSLCYSASKLWQVAGHPKRVVAVDPGGRGILGEIGVHPKTDEFCGLWVDEESCWIGPEQDGWIERYDRNTCQVVRRYGPVPSGDGLVRLDGRLWYTSYRAACLAAIDLESGEEVARYELPGRPTDLCFDGKWFWYNNYPERMVCAVQVDL